LNYSAPERNAPGFQIKEIENSKTQEHVIYGMGCFYELTKWIIVLIIAITLLHFFVATIFIVDGASMEPNYHSGQVVLANRFQYIFQTPKRGDVVILRFPGDAEHKKYIKRIVGVPGDHIKIANGKVYINDRVLNEAYIPSSVYTYAEYYPDVVLKPGDYYLIGDNRLNSNDSRIWGVANRRFLIGRAWFIFWPNMEVVRELTY